LVAERTSHENGTHEIIAVGRLTRSRGTRDAEVAVLVTDRYQHGGLGTELLARLIQVAHDENVERIVATILLENVAMRAMASRQGFQIQKDSDLGVVQAVLTL
jgi:acetyltransferase